LEADVEVAICGLTVSLRQAMRRGRAVPRSAKQICQIDSLRDLPPKMNAESERRANDEAGDFLFKRKQSLLFFIREGLKNGIVS